MARLLGGPVIRCLGGSVAILVGASVERRRGGSVAVGRSLGRCISRRAPQQRARRQNQIAKLFAQIFRAEEILDMGMDQPAINFLNEQLID